jgi:DNA-binding transcriptional LysR family regulator
VELDGELGEPATIVAILTGAGAMRNRLPERLRPLWERLFGTEVVRVPWDEVEDIDVAVRLKRGGRDLGLGLGDDRWGWAMRRLPDS